MADNFLSPDDKEILTGEGDDFDIATDGFNSDELDSGGELVDREGAYHFEITDVKPELDTVREDGNDNTPNILFTLTVLETVKGQSPAGSRLWHRIYVGSKGGGPPADGSIKSMIVFGKGLRLLKDIEHNGKKIAVDAQSGQPKLSLALWMRAKGLQCIGNVKKEEDKTGQYKTRYGLPFGRIYHPHDERIAHVAKNADALKMLGPVETAKSDKATPNPAEQPKQEPENSWGIADL
jgi:hypothetical protein